MTKSKVELIKIVPIKFNNHRLDVALSALLPEYSRSTIQTWINQQYITVNDMVLRTKDKVQSGQTIAINAPLQTNTTSQPQAIPLDIVYADQDIIVVNKPVGLVTHPGAGRSTNTLLNALLYHYPELATVPRAGIIHRLDKDTSGLLVIARNLTAHTKLITELQQRKIKREYIAIVIGDIITGGTIEAPIGRHRKKRTHMAVSNNGKPATTHYRVLQRFTAYTYLKVILVTGRTHQIRVHFAHIGYPIVGDPTYGKGLKLPKNCCSTLQQILRGFKHQALHAQSLELNHPKTAKTMRWEAPLPKTIKNLLQALSQ